MEKKRTITLAPDLEITRLREWVDKVLEIMDHSEALVTDWSTLWDFSPCTDDPNYDKWYDDLSEKLGFGITKADPIWRLAARLRQEERE